MSPGEGAAVQKLEYLPERCLYLYCGRRGKGQIALQWGRSTVIVKRSQWFPVSFAGLNLLRLTQTLLLVMSVSQMSTATIAARPQQSLKRLLDKPLDDSGKWKLARRTPQPASTELSACLGPRNSSQNQPPSRVGRYVLLERYEGEELYRAQHSQTRKQFTCQVLGLQIKRACSKLHCSVKATDINIKIDTCASGTDCVLFCFFTGSILA